MRTNIKKEERLFSVMLRIYLQVGSSGMRDMIFLHAFIVKLKPHQVKNKNKERTVSSVVPRKYRHERKFNLYTILYQMR